MKPLGATPNYSSLLLTIGFHSAIVIAVIFILPLIGGLRMPYDKILLINPNQMKPVVTPIALDYLGHTLKEIGYDEDGWYATMKGDNNPYTDPGKVRFDQIERLVVAIIY